MAPRLKLTDQVRLDLARMLVSGASIEVAANAAGVSERSAQRWLQRGRELRDREEAGGRIRPEDRPYLELLSDVERAYAQGEVHALASIRRAAGENWRAAAWELENLYGYGTHRRPGRPVGATSAPDRPSTAGAPPRIRLRSVN